MSVIRRVKTYVIYKREGDCKLEVDAPIASAAAPKPTTRRHVAVTGSVKQLKRQAEHAALETKPKRDNSRTCAEPTAIASKK